MTYRVVNTRRNPHTIISPPFQKKRAIEAALLLKRLGMLCIVVPNGACAPFAHDIIGAAQLQECEDLLRDTQEFSADDVDSLLAQCVSCAPVAQVLR